MTTAYRRSVLHSLAALLIAAAPAAAQDRGVIGEDGTLATIKEQVNAALPPVIGQDNAELARMLLNPPLAAPLRETFSLPVALRAWFGFSQPVFAPDCARATTPTGEPDQGECQATQGTPGGPGAFKMFAFSKNIGVGNLRFILREGMVDPDKLQPTKLDDASAQKVAVNFLLKIATLPQSELPLPPADSPNPFAFVKTLTLGSADERGEPPMLLGIQKLVVIPRGLKVELRDPAGGQGQSFVPASGLAKVLIGMNKDGMDVVLGAMVENWRELRPNPELDPANAKTREELATEITEDLFNDGGGRIAKVSAHIVYSVDWRGTHGLLVPAVQVNVTPVSGPLDQSQFGQILDQKIGTAGTQREFALIGSPQPREPAPTR